MNNNKIENLAPATTAHEAVKKQQMDAAIAAIPFGGDVDLTPYLKKDGSVQMTGDLKLGNNQVRAWNVPLRSKNKKWESWRGDITVDGDLI